MANDLTGDFDVVGQFSLPAVNRLLSAMHGIKRFAHSLALRVDDIPQPPDRVRPSVFEIIDILGDPVANPRRIRLPDLSAVTSPETRLAFGALDGIVNIRDAGIFLPPILPSRLQGRAQLQLSPPTIEIADAAASRIAVRMQIKARYFADPGTPPVAEFAKGDLVLTTAVTQITSQVGNVVDIDLRSNAVQVSFTPTWSNRPLSAEDRAGINLLIGNALKSSALPSNTTLPSDIRAMKFKALAGSEQAIAILLNTASPPGNPASVQRVFLGGSDFAFGVGADTIQAALQPVLDEILVTPIPTVSISIPLVFTSATATYTIKLNTATAAMQAGRILLTIKGRATSPSWFAPNFDFTMTQAFGLQPDGSTADLVIGNMTLDTTSWIVDRFRGRAMGPMAAARDRALSQSGAAASVRRMLDADRNLGGFLRSLLTPARPDNQPQPPPLAVGLAYASVEISVSGIVLRGTLAVGDPPPAHVEFAEIAASGGGPLAGAVPAEPEYSGFKSWIPGGTIESYEWKRAGVSQPGPQDENTFVLLPQGPVISEASESSSTTTHGPLAAFHPMCLTIRGKRLSASGQVRLEQVNASFCAFPWFPLLDVLRVPHGAVPLVPLTRRGRHGEVEVVGHAAAGRDNPLGPTRTPNLIVHFGEPDATAELELILDALRRSDRRDAATVVVAVLRAGALDGARYVPQVVFVEQTDGEWERAWGVTVRRRPTTFVIGPTAKVAAQYEGSTDVPTLAQTLRRVLVAKTGTQISTAAPVRLGHPPPNFLFSHAAGHELTLRKLAGRPVILVFWRSDATVSLDAVRDATAAAGPAWRDAAVLAINDGETPDSAVPPPRGSIPHATIVPDPSRAVARAFGVNVWPTLVLIDARGVVRDVRYGVSRGDDEDRRQA